MDRFGISDRSGAFLASSVLQDFGIIHETDKKQKKYKEKPIEATLNSKRNLTLMAGKTRH